MHILVQLRGISRRAKDRIRQHGSTMELLDKQGDKILVKSLGKTWKGIHWLGWFNAKNDVGVAEPIEVQTSSAETK